MRFHPLTRRDRRVLWLLAATTPLALTAQPRDVFAYTRTPTLDSLVRIAGVEHPGIRAALARRDATAARGRSAGSWPDPILMGGIQNLPMARERSLAGAADPMTMRMAGIAQSIPYRGKSALQARVAREEGVATEVDIDVARRDVVASVKRAYLEIALLQEAIRLANSVATLARAREGATRIAYESGRGSQAAVLNARRQYGEATLGIEVLRQDEVAATARLNVLLGRPVNRSTPVASLPPALMTLLFPDSSHGATRDTRSGAWVGLLGSEGDIDSLAAAHPVARAWSARIDAQRARLALARRAHLPDVEVAISYGQRPGYPDMLTATVSLPLPVRREQRQGAEVGAAVADLRAMEAEQAVFVATWRGEVAARLAETKRFANEVRATSRLLLPPARAALTAVAAVYDRGEATLVEVLEQQASVLILEQSRLESLRRMALAFVELERLTGEGQS